MSIPKEEIKNLTNYHLINFQIFKYITKCSQYGARPLKYGRLCFECNKTLTSDNKGKLYTNKLFAFIHTLINKFHRQYYTPTIDRLVCNFYHVKIPGKWMWRINKICHIAKNMVV